MNSANTIAPPAGLSEKQRKALLNLLADEDPEIFRTVRDTILAQGPESAAWVRQQALSNDPVLRRRATNIVNHFERQKADDAFLAFCLNHGRDLPLETGVWLLARTRYPECNMAMAAYEALLDAYAGDARELLAGADGARSIVAVFNDYLFGQLGFSGNDRDYYDPQNNYLNRVIDRRTGNPINLCTLYILLARRLQLPISGIGLPGHFVCRYQSSAEEFYIDVFNQGRILAKADCIRYLLQGNFQVREYYLSPVSPRRLLLRTCTNLHQIWLQRGDQEEATRLQHYIVALAK